MYHGAYYDRVALETTYDAEEGQLLTRGIRENGLRVERRLPRQDPETGHTLNNKVSRRILTEKQATGFLQHIQRIWSSRRVQDKDEGSKDWLLHSFRVCVLAEKYDVKPLQYLARGQFALAAEICMGKKWFAEVVEEIYSTDLPPGVEMDRLKEIVPDAILRHYFASEDVREKLQPPPCWMLTQNW